MFPSYPTMHSSLMPLFACDSAHVTHSIAVAEQSAVHHIRMTSQCDLLTRIAV